MHLVIEEHMDQSEMEEGEEPLPLEVVGDEGDDDDFGGCDDGRRWSGVRRGALESAWSTASTIERTSHCQEEGVFWAVSREAENRCGDVVIKDKIGSRRVYRDCIQRF